MSKIFISYRRRDSEDAAGRITDWLVREFGRESVFIDVDSIPPGVDFKDHMQRALKECIIFVSVIGPGWVMATDENGEHRLGDPNDHVRVELESALARVIPVLPILVQGAEMPSEKELPDTLKPFSFMNALSIRSGRSFRVDMDSLIITLRSYLSNRKDDEESASDEAGRADMGKGFVSGLWTIPLHVEPGVASRIGLSPGAEFLILGEEEYKGEKWSHVRCADGRDGWLKGIVAESESVKGRLAPFSKQDKRTFFRTLHGSSSQTGFILNRVQVSNNGSGSGGSMDSLPFQDQAWGEVNIDIAQIQEIQIDRRGANSRVTIRTDRQTYQGEFPPVQSIVYGIFLVVSRPFLGLADVTKEIDLRTVDYALIEKIDSPPCGESV